MNKQQSIQMVIDRINKSENINKKYNIKFTKYFLRKRITNFKLEDFDCFATNGNTRIEPDVYYSKITPEKKLDILDSVENQLFHNTNNGDMRKRVLFDSLELGTNLLRCCEKCVDIWLRTMFHFNFIKHMFNKSVEWFDHIGRCSQVCGTCNEFKMCAIHFENENWCCRKCFSF